MHGGVLLELMDKVAYACASKHAGGYCVTVSVEGVHFRAPVEVGDLVSMHAAVNYVGRSSILVGIRVEAENVATRTERHTNSSYFWMVAKDDAGNLREVPPLRLDTRDEVRRFIEGKRRRVLRRARVEALDNEASARAVDDARETLAEERCVIAPSCLGIEVPEPEADASTP